MDIKFYQIKPHYIGIVNNHRIYSLDRYITDDILFFKGGDPSLDGILITRRMKKIIEKYNIEPLMINEEVKYNYSIKHNIKSDLKKLPTLYELRLMPQIDSFANSQLIFRTEKGKIIITDKMKQIIKEECKHKRIKTIDINKKEHVEEKEEIIVQNKSIYKQQKENYLFQIIIMLVACVGLILLL